MTERPEDDPTRMTGPIPETVADRLDDPSLLLEQTGAATAVPPTAPYSEPTPRPSASYGAWETLDANLRIEPGRMLFGRFLTVRELGRGGMGMVWLVRRTEFDVERAVKMIVGNFAHNPDARARFSREAQVMAKFIHPNAVVFHDARLTETDVAYIEMEYVQGQGLEKLVPPGQPMPLDWAARILTQLCDVLQSAHDRGIIHRDLKPSNLMLVDGRPEGQEQLKVLDFGIAKFLGPETREGDAHTRTGAFMGTPPYTSPEQATGEAEPSSDLYSTGIILYELLTGHRPFGGPPARMIYDTISSPPPPFAQINPNVSVPPEVERVVMRCLAKEPKDRPRSARELAEEFRAAMAPKSLPADVPRDSGSKSLPKWLIPAAAVVLVGVAFGIYQFGSSKGKGPSEPGPNPPVSNPIGPTAVASVTPTVKPPGPITTKVEPTAIAPIAKRPFRTEADVLTAIREHLEKAPEAERTSRRYFTLAQLYNDPRLAEGDLRLARAAVSKALNSLSWRPKVVVPETVDSEGTILAVDVRELGWKPGADWNEVLKPYPYGITHETAADKSLRRTSAEVAEMSGVDLPHVRADWFVARAMRPPLYRKMLTSLGERETGTPLNLKSIEAAFQEPPTSATVVRALVAGGSVARHRRIIDRIDGPRGTAVWRVLDFKEPARLGAPKKEPAERKSLGELSDLTSGMFTLPNGLKGFLLRDDGRELDRASTEVLRDPKSIAGDEAVVHGLSCLGCHRHGVVRFRIDPTRPPPAPRLKRAVGGPVLAQPAWDVRFAREESAYLEALGDAIGPFLQEPVAEAPEPIVPLAKLYAAPLTLDDVARELNQPDPAQLRAKIAASTKLREVGLAALLEGKPITREAWSAMLDVVVPELRLGTIYRAH